MTALLTSLPGDIPGLLRACSPARGRYGGRRVVLSTESGLAGHAVVSDYRRAPLIRLADLALDLTDPTGRAHAAWWCTGQNEDAFGRAIEALPGGLFAARAVYDAAFGGADMTPTQIDTLARLVLRLAGRTA